MVVSAVTCWPLTIIPGGWTPARSPLRAKEGQDCKHSAVRVRLLTKVELEEDLADVCLHGLRTQEQPLADRVVRASLSDEPEHVTLSVGKLGQRASRPRFVQETRDDRGS